MDQELDPAFYEEWARQETEAYDNREKINKHIAERKAAASEKKKVDEDPCSHNAFLFFMVKTQGSVLVVLLMHLDPCTGF